MNKNTIKTKLDDFINELFYEIQEEENIKSGDIDFGMAFELDEQMDAIVDTIERVISFQKELTQSNEH